MEEERRRREEAERRLQDETAHRQRLVEEEVKMREKHFSQVSGAAGGDGSQEAEGGGRLGDGDERRGTKRKAGCTGGSKMARGMSKREKGQKWERSREGEHKHSIFV